jgi:mannose-6-phosphate isomerase-like protein (cupin superfamily)
VSSPTVIPPLAGRVMGSLQNNFVIAEWRQAGAPAGPPRYIAPVHMHYHDDEAWYVLEGKLNVLVGDQAVELSPGAGVLVQRGTRHTYWNPAPGPVRYLLIMTPNIYALIQGIHGMKERSPEALSALFKRHGSELVL